MRSLLVLLVLASPALAETPVRNLELFATADIHGHLEPSLVPTGSAPVRYVARGGIALLGGFLDNARARFPGRVLLLDGGDLFQGTLASNLTEGATMIRGLNQLGYAAAALGNHEFDYGPVGAHATPAAGDDPRGALHARVAEARFPFLAANVTTPRGEKLVAPYFITELDGVQIGIVGGTSEGLYQTTMRANLTGLEVGPLAPAIVRAAAEARDHGARVILVAVHAGGECTRSAAAISSERPGDLTGCKAEEEVFDLAHALAAATAKGGPPISAIVGGHTHQPITATVDGIPIIQAGKNGLYLAHVSLEVRGRGQQAAPTGRFSIEKIIDVCAFVDATGRCAAKDERGAKPVDYFGPVRPDAGVEAAIAADLVKAHAVAARPIGIDLPEGVPTSYNFESPLGNLVADALRSSTRADVGFINGGGLRADLPPGPLTFGALYESFPFENEVVTIDMTGAELLGLVVRNLESEHGALSYSGLHVKAACRAGKLETTLRLGERALDPAARYKVATVDFLAHGGDGALDKQPKLGPSLGVVRAVLEATLHAHGGTLRPSDPGLFDPAHRRVELPGPRPLRCGAKAEEQRP